MADPVIPIDVITQKAHAAAEAGEPATACPYPDHWLAADKWRRAYHARAQELIAELTT